ncbi:SDR family oxidoreductase [Flavobacterium sp. MAH-1]|uniref:SDR family oxidoreductase n=1 Tax=Flavobacterium agri TaxID=2743471 RepID=A0A7Y8Y2C4_9FLAO|nr:SDR family oxidoreductase [Flavobacterium agri]NUY79925.1 SDR family oxidoreductase [Flavobacterium agri]NYA69950.1 SDR family oxidoreductase [Flavobacterium agri]
MGDFSATGYWAVVLGGSSGLGFASAKKLAEHGMNVCVIYRSPRSEKEMLETNFYQIRKTGVEFLEFNADALNSDKQLEILSKLKNAMGEGKVRCLLHSIAKGNLKAMDGLDSLSSDDFRTTFDAMAASLYEWTKLLFNAGLFAADARILAFTSEGSTKAWKHYAAVSSAKAALEAISRSIALEFAPHGIRSNCIQAGVTDTAALRMIPGNEDLVKHSISRNPFKRLTAPEDVANVVYLMNKDESAWINGTIIPVNGGEHLQ